jgi:hypothetical protein
MMPIQEDRLLSQSSDRMEIWDELIQIQMHHPTISRNVTT